MLIAPSWGDLNIMDTIALPLIERLTPTYDVIVRPHPGNISNEILDNLRNLRPLFWHMNRLHLIWIFNLKTQC